MGKTDSVPAAVDPGIRRERQGSGAQSLVMPRRPRPLPMTDEAALPGGSRPRADRAAERARASCCRACRCCSRSCSPSRSPNGWKQVTDLQRDVFFVAFIATAAASILLIAPSAYHRLRWREGDKEHMLADVEPARDRRHGVPRARDDGGRLPDHGHPLQGLMGRADDGADRGRLRLVLVRPAAQPSTCATGAARSR